MRARGSVSFSALESAAARSGDGEAFELVERRPGIRIGVGVRLGKDGAARPFVEAILDPFPERPRVDLESLGRVGRLVEELQIRGYELKVEDDGSVVAEARLPAQHEVEELDRIRAWLLDSTR